MTSKLLSVSLHLNFQLKVKLKGLIYKEILNMKGENPQSKLPVCDFHIRNKEVNVVLIYLPISNFVV